MPKITRAFKNHNTPSPNYHWIFFLLLVFLSSGSTDLTAEQRETLVFPNKVVEGLESQVQGLVLCNFAKVTSCQVLMVQQGFTQWFL